MKLGVLTDIHLCPPGSPPDGWHNPHQFETVAERLERAMAWLAARGVDQVAVLGDLSHMGDAASLRAVVDILGASGLQTWVLPGNHDLVPDPVALATAVADAGHDHVRLLDGAAIPFGPTWQVAGLVMVRAETGGFRADPEPEMDAWGERPTVLLAHYPVLSIRDDAAAANLKYAGDLANGEPQADALRQRPAPTLIVHGHLHIRHATASGSALQASCGAQVESLFEVTVFDLGGWDDGRVSWQATAIQDIWPGVNPALSDPTQSWRWSGSAWTPDRFATGFP